MILFFIGLIMLVVGYYTYGKFVEKIVGPDNRPTPAITKRDGVDYLILPHWKNMLIQLLNIAGVGPVIGVIIGIKFGEWVFLIIPLGNIIAGATHDFLAGMMSIRGNGVNLPTIVKNNLGKLYSKFFSVFTIGLLLLVVAVFIDVPAKLVDKMLPSYEIFWYAVVAIFVYYVIATLFPIDKIIGKCYPLFGGMLLVGTLAIFASMIYMMFDDVNMLTPTTDFLNVQWDAENGHPIIPLLFVTIACGIISGFHATQSPIIARTIASERQARSSFYGMMVLEGFIAMVWAGAAMVIYNEFPDSFGENPTNVLLQITNYFLGSYVGVITVVAVIILAVTSGDTAMRSVRLSFAEMFSINQKTFSKRLLVCLPFIVIVSLLLTWAKTDAESFNNLWNYFAWGNQVLAVSTLFAGAVWLFSQQKNGYIALIPGAFMCFIVLCYILWISPQHGGPVGFGLDLDTSYWIAGALTLLIVLIVKARGEKMASLKCKDWNKN